MPKTKNKHDTGPENSFVIFVILLLYRFDVLAHPPPPLGRHFLNLLYVSQLHTHSPFDIFTKKRFFVCTHINRYTARMPPKSSFHIQFPKWLFSDRIGAHLNLCTDAPAIAKLLLRKLQTYSIGKWSKNVECIHMFIRWLTEEMKANK